MTIFLGAGWKFSLVLWSYTLKPAEVLHMIFKTKTNMYEKIVKKKKEKELATETLM